MKQTESPLHDAHRTLHNPKATKEELRAALARSLGVDYTPATKGQADSLFSDCRSLWMTRYLADTGLDYSFSAVDAVSLKAIITKMQRLTDEQEQRTLEALAVLFERLPAWYKENAYSLPVVNKKFNEIIASIRKEYGKQKQPAEHKERLLALLRTR